MRYILDAVNRGNEMPFAEGAAHEAALFGLVASTDDMREGTRAFLEKRKPGLQRPDNGARSSKAHKSAARFSFAIVVSKYHDFVTDRLQAAAVAALEEGGRRPPTRSRSCACLARSRLPIAARHAAESGEFAAVVCLGCLIRGATPHFEFIASAVAHGLTAAAATPACR